MSKPDKPEPDCYATRALSEIELEGGGRFAKDRRTIFTGKPHEPLPVPAWCRDPVPQEPLLDEAPDASEDAAHIVPPPSPPPAPVSPPHDAVETETSGDGLSKAIPVKRLLEQ